MEQSRSSSSMASVSRSPLSTPSPTARRRGPDAGLGTSRQRLLSTSIRAVRSPPAARRAAMTTSSESLAPFGLRVAPFSKEIGDGDLWLPESKAALVSDIEEALAERQSVLLLGEPGVGKPCVLRALRHRLPQAGFRLTYCRNATLGRRDFYRYLCHAMAHLHILLNYEWDSRALLSLVLVGLPELEGRMALRCHRSLLTRIHHRFLIEPATVDDTAEYLAFRLGRAGADHEIFSHE